jgi:hypothetical protein
MQLPHHQMEQSLPPVHILALFIHPLIQVSLGQPAQLLVLATGTPLPHPLMAQTLLPLPITTTSTLPLIQVLPGTRSPILLWQVLLVQQLPFGVP